MSCQGRLIVLTTRSGLLGQRTASKQCGIKSRGALRSCSFEVMPYRFEPVPILKILRQHPDLKLRPIDQVVALAYAVHRTHGGRPVEEVDAELRRQLCRSRLHAGGAGVQRGRAGDRTKRSAGVGDTPACPGVQRRP